MQTSTLTVNGQVTIPTEILDRLDAKVGSQIGFDISSDGRITLVKTDIDQSMAGILKNKIKNTTPVSIEDMNKAISSGWQSHGGN